MEKKTRNIIIGASAAAAGAVALGAVSYTITHYLVKIALDREVPKGVKKIEKAADKLRGYAEPDGFTEHILNCEAAFEKLELQTVEIESFDGERLIGHWYPCEKAKRIIIAMHGWRSSWARDFGSIADFWHGQGCSILFAEQRGQGNSGGEYMGFGLIERYDCLEWAKWVDKNLNTDLPIYLAGVSMGATTVLMASCLGMPSNVKGILADCGFTSPHAIFKHVVENNLHMSFGIRSKIADDLCKKKINIGSKDHSATAALAENKIPVIFVHGTDDHFVPIEMTFQNYKACAAPKKLLVVPGADHGMSYFTDKSAYEKATVDFFAEYDK